MQTCVGRSIVDKHLAIFVGYPAVGEGYIHHIADIFVSFGNEEPSTWSGDDACRVIKGGHIHIEHITEPGSSGTHAVSKVEPAFGGLNGCGAFTVLNFIDGMIGTWVDDAFVAHLSMRDIRCERPADSSAFAGLDKAVLWTGV